MTRHSYAITAVVVALLGATAAPGQAQATTHVCDGASGFLSATNMTCRQAGRIAHKWAVRAQTAGPNPTLTIEGFTCRPGQPQEVICRRGHRRLVSAQEP